MVPRKALKSAEEKPRSAVVTPAVDAPEALQDAAAFEPTLAELERLVATLEQGDLTLEQSLAAFERGVGLARNCQAMLRQAEQRVHALVGQGEDSFPEPFSDASATGS